jgi:hypothetical protein
LIGGLQDSRGNQQTPADCVVVLPPNQLLRYFSAQHISQATDRLKMAPSDILRSALVLYGLPSSVLVLQSSGSSRKRQWQQQQQAAAAEAQQKLPPLHMSFTLLPLQCK